MFIGEIKLHSFIITGQLKLKQNLAIFLGGHDVLPSPVRHFGGTCPPVPRGIYAPEYCYLKQCDIGIHKL